MKRYDLELTATGPVMEERKEGAFVPFSEVSGLADTVMKMGDRSQLLADLLREATRVIPAIGVTTDDMPVVDAFLERIEDAVSGEDSHQTGITLSAADLVELADFCSPDRDTDPEQLETEIVLFYRRAFKSTDGDDMPAGVYVHLADYPEEGLFGPVGGRLLVGKRPDRPDNEWTDVAASPTAEDYRELQAQHDQVQSRMKAALDFVRDSEPVLREAMDAFNWECGGVGEDEARALHNRIDALLADQLPSPTVTITETIRTAPERIWLQVGDQSHYHSEPFPSDTSEVSWCADSVTGCEVPYVRADLAAPAVLQGGEPCATEPPSFSPA